MIMLAANVAPIDSATGSIVGYILNYGVLGVVALALAFRFLVPRSAIEEARDQARGDLEKELGRVLAEKTRIEEERDEALKVAQVQLVPLLVQFTATTSALIPLLQELVRSQEGRRRGGSG
jgi:hypothetical protein